MNIRQANSEGYTHTYYNRTTILQEDKENSLENLQIENSSSVGKQRDESEVCIQKQRQSGGYSTP